MDAKEQCRTIMTDHLQSYISRNPSATFKSWITDLHPEKVNDSERLLMWKAQSGMQGSDICGLGDYKTCGRNEEISNSSASNKNDDESESKGFKDC